MRKILRQFAWAPTDSGSCQQIWSLIAMVSVASVAALLIGCGGDATTPSTTSNDEIAAFIEEHPEYGDSPSAAGTSAKTSKPKPLGLER